MGEQDAKTIYLNSDKRRQSSSSEAFDLKEVIKFFLRHVRLFLSLVIISCIIVSLHHYKFPLHRARATIYLESKDTQIQMINNRMQGNAFQEVREELSDKYIRYMQSLDFLMAAAHSLREKKMLTAFRAEIDRPKSIMEYISASLSKKKPAVDAYADPDELYEDNLEAVANFQKAGSDGIIVQVTASDRELARSVADEIAEEAVRWITTTELKKINDAVKYISDRINESETNIQKLNEEMFLFKKNNKIYSIESTDTTMSSNSLDREMEIAKVEFQQNEAMIEKYTKKLKKQEEAAFAGVSGAENLTFKYKTDLAQKISEKESQNQILEARIASIQHHIDRTFSGREMNLEQTIYDFRKKFELEYSLYQELKKEMFRVEMQKVSMSSKVQNLQKAQYSEVNRTVSLSKKLGITVFVALAIGGLISFLTEMLWPTVKSRNDLDLLGFTFLGNVPDFTYSVKRKSSALFCKFNNKISRVFRFDTDTLPITAFFKIRTKILHHLEQSKTVKPVISFVSAGMGEGKTFTASNMAASIASLNKKTLFIDADMRAAGASNLFQCMDGGLADVLNAPEQFGRHVVTGLVPNLDVLPAGRKLQNPTELLASPQFKELIEKLRFLYEYIIIDTPPLLVASDAAIVEKNVDMVIFVASFNKTQQEALARACDNILDFGVKNQKFFSVLNKVDSRYDTLVMLPYPYYGKAYKKQSAMD